MNNYKNYRNLLALLMVTMLVSGCANKAAHKGGKKTNEGRYKVTKDYGPDTNVDVSHVPDAVPKVEFLSRGGNKSEYQVFGKSYSVMANSLGYKERGGASWYGKKFHGYLTANGDKYDMYGMSAAHKSLPLPTYVKVTNLANNKVVIVRVNDRGPFHQGRIIDLSYAAASKLGMLNSGTGQVEVEAINPLTWQVSKKVASQVAKNEAAEPQVKQPLIFKPAKLSVSTASVATQAVTDKVLPATAAANVPDKDLPAPAAANVPKKAPSKQPIRVEQAPRTDKYLGIHYVQVGVYSTEQAAHAVTLKVNDLGLPVLISELQKQQRKLYKVILGPMKSRMRTEQLKMILADRSFAGAHLIDLPK